MKRGIISSEMAFESDFDSFVRETIQNSNDAIRNGTGEVIFSLKDLDGKQLQDFKKAINWEDYMSHLEGAANTGRMKKISDFVEGHSDGENIRILKIEDRGCEGLTGDEDDEDSNFYGLTKGIGYSNKKEDSSGGSYGMGKSVFSKFSQAGTVIYASNPRDSDKEMRLFGRTMLPDHETEKGEFQGNGMFGEGSEDFGAKSVWGKNAADLAEKLHVSHSDKSTGTSISIVGFSDPTLSSRRDRDEIKDKIDEAAAEYFWPAIESQDQRLNVYVESETQPVDPSNKPGLTSFVELLQSYERQNFDEELENAGDIIHKEIDVEVPKHREEGETKNSSVDLVIRLSEDGEKHSNKLAKFRGPKMVVEYDEKSNWAVGGRPFHAILVCGEARNEVSEGDRDVEKFLRSAEPPEHDDWRSTEKMRGQYKQPYKKRLDEMEEQVEEELRKAVMKETDLGERGAEKLSEMIPYGKAAGETTSGSKFNFKNRDGYIQDSRWIFEGDVEAEEEGNWTLKVSVSSADEEGKSVRQKNIADANMDRDHRIEDGELIVDVEEDTKSLHFEVETEKLSESDLDHEAMNLETQANMK
jgi:hypothetical protein